MLKSEIPRELDLAPPNAAGKQAEGKPFSAVIREKWAERCQALWDGTRGTLGAP